MEETDEQARQAVIILQRLRNEYLQTLGRILDSARRDGDSVKAKKFELLFHMIRPQENPRYAQMVKVENGLKRLVESFFQAERGRNESPGTLNAGAGDLQSPESPPSMSHAHTMHSEVPKTIPMERTDAKKYSYDRDGSAGRATTQDYRHDRSRHDLYQRRRDYKDYNQSRSYSRDRIDRVDSRRDGEYERRGYSPNRGHSASRGRSPSGERYVRNPTADKFARSVSRDRLSGSPGSERWNRSTSRERFGCHPKREPRCRSPSRDHDKYYQNNHKYREHMKRDPDDRYSDSYNGRSRRAPNDRYFDYEKPIKKEPINDKYEKYETVTPVSIKNEPRFEPSPSPQPSTSTSTSTPSSSNIFDRLGPKGPSRPFENCHVEILPSKLTREEIDDVIKENNDRAGKPEGIDELQKIQDSLKQINDLDREIAEQEDKKVLNDILKEMVVTKAILPIKKVEDHRSATNSPRPSVGSADIDISARVSNIELQNRPTNDMPQFTERLANKYKPRPRPREETSPHNTSFINDNNSTATNSQRPDGPASDPRMRNRDPRMATQSDSVTTNQSNIFANMNSCPFGNREGPSIGLFSQMNSQLPPNIPSNIRGVFGGFPKPNEPTRYGSRPDTNPNPFNGPNPFATANIGPSAFNNNPANNFNRTGFNPMNIDGRRFSMSSPSAPPFEAEPVNYRFIQNDSVERHNYEMAKRERERGGTFPVEPQSYREHRLAKEREARERAKKDATARVTQDEACTSSSSPIDPDATAATAPSTVDKAFRNNNWKELPSTNATKSFKIPKKKKPDESSSADNQSTKSKDAEKSASGKNKNSIRVREADTGSNKDNHTTASDRKSDNSIGSNQSEPTSMQTDFISRDPRQRPRTNTVVPVQSEEKHIEDSLDGAAVLQKIIDQCRDQEGFFEMIAPVLGDKLASTIKTLVVSKKVPTDDGDVSSSTGVTDAAESNVEDDEEDDFARDDEVADSCDLNKSDDPLPETPARKPHRKRSNELSRLHEDLRSMFMTNNGGLNFNGHRLCKLARSSAAENASAKSKDKPKKLNKTLEMGASTSADESDENLLNRARRKQNEKAKATAEKMPKRIMQRRNTSAAFQPPPPPSDDECETEVIQKPAPRKRITQRRNTLASRMENLLSDHKPNVPEVPKKVGRRRLTRCEFIDQPSSDSDKQGPIRLKIISREAPATPSSHKRKKRKTIASDNERENEIGTKDNDQEQSSSAEDSDIEVEVERVDEPLRKIVKKNTQMKRPRSEDDASKSNKKSKKPTDVQPTRARLSRECKVVLNKMDAASMAAATMTTAETKKRTSEAAAVDHGDDLLEAIATETDEPKSKRTKVKKNTNKMMYTGNPEFDKQCPACSYRGKFLSSHFVNRHRGIEYALARPSPEMADAMRANRTVVTRLGKNRFSALCYFCKESKELSKQMWIYHIVRHTGEFPRECSTCKHIYIENKHKCNDPKPITLNSFHFYSNFDGYICKICNFVQIRKAAMVEHLQKQHAISTGIESQYDAIQFLYNFHGGDANEVKMEEDDVASAPKTPSDSVAFKASQPDEEGLFDQDTMNLIKQNISFSEEDKPKPTNSQSMIDKLSIRFKINDPPETDEKVQIIYKGPEDEPVDEMEPNIMPSSSIFSSHTTNSSTSVNDPVGDGDLAKTEDDIMDFENDDDEWEDCSNSSELGEEAEPTPAPSITKNISIQQTLNRLFIRTKKPKPSAATSTLIGDKLKSIKKDTSIPETKVTEEVAPITDAAASVITNNHGQPLSIASVSGNVQMPMDVPIDEPGNDGERVAIVIENICAVKQWNKFEFQCVISGCNFQAPHASSLYDHLQEHENIVWSGSCTACFTDILPEPHSLEMELAHLTNVHCRKQSEEASASQTKPTIKVRRLSGDLLSTPFGDVQPPPAKAMPTPTITVPIITKIHSGAEQLSSIPKAIKVEPTESKKELLIGNIVLKPWIHHNVRTSKRTEDVDKLLRRISLCARFKCMGEMCIFTTDDATKMRQHLDNHERQAVEGVPFGNQSDTDSWLECAYCDEICSSCTLLVQHVQEHHSNSIYQCPKCFYRSAARMSVIKHCEKYHSKMEPNIIQCNDPPKKSEKEKNSMAEGRLKYLKPIKCPVGDACVGPFFAFEQLQDHLSSEHESIQQWNCGECPLIVSKDNYFKHLSIHGIASYQCLHCPMSSNASEMMHSHMSEQHADKIAYICARYPLTRKVPTELQKSLDIKDATVLAKLDTKITATVPVWINDYDPHQMNFMDPSLEAWTQNAQDPPAKQDLSIQPVQDTLGNIDANGSLDMSTSMDDAFAGQSQPPPTKRPRRNCSITPNKLTSSPVAAAKPSPTGSPLRAASAAAKLDATASSSPSKVISSLQNEVDAAAKAILNGTGLDGKDLYRCGNEDCNGSVADTNTFNVHLQQHSTFKCYHCKKTFAQPLGLVMHMKEHEVHRFFCYYCDMTTPTSKMMKQHFSDAHKKSKTSTYPLNTSKKDLLTDKFVVYPGSMKENKEFGIKLIKRMQEMRSNKKFYSPNEIDLVPQSNIYSEPIYCALCRYETKVRTNMIRHLKDCRENLQSKTVAMGPVNPVPCLDTGKKHFDAMINLAASSNDAVTSATIDTVCRAIPDDRRFLCGTADCRHQTVNEELLRSHIVTLHGDEQTFICSHCNKLLCDGNVGDEIDEIIYHMRMHDTRVFKCPKCNFCHAMQRMVDKHIIDEHPRCKDKPIFMTHGPKSNMTTEAAAARGSSGARATVMRWKCTICKVLVASKALMQQHITDVHRITAKYLCNMCGYQSDNKSSFGEHFAAKHSGQEIGFKNYYDRVEVNDDIDVTPLWRRDDPNRIKHIRGILVDEEVSKRARNRAVRKTSSSSSLDSTRTLGLDMEANSSESIASSAAMGEDGKKKLAKRTQGSKKQK